MTILAGACIGGALVLPGRSLAVDRLERIAVSRERAVPEPPLPPTSGGSVRAPVVTGLAAVAGWQLLGGPAGLATALVVLVLVPIWLHRLEPAELRAARVRIAADLPVTLDLLAGCLRAGAAPPRALAVVADAVGGPLGQRLAAVAGHVRLGADPATAWAELADLPALAPLVRSVTRSLESGASWGPVLERAARDLRARRQVAGEARARTVAVKAVAPLGACFLPAFVLLGIVPAVWGLATATFTSGL